MTDPVITIAPTEVSVEPGGQARVEITVRNPSAIVEGYRIEVLGETPGVGPSVWAQVHPAELRIYPQERANAILVLAPPADVTVGQSGRFPFAVRAVSTVTDGVSAVAEGDVEVGRMFGLQATITPMTSTGRWRGHHLIKYTNWGNAPVRLRIAAHDPDQRLGFLLRASELELSLGASAETRLTVRTRKPSLRGTQQRLAFEVVGESDQPGAPRPPGPSLPGDPRRPVLTAAFLQKPILSRATVAIAGLAVAAVAAAIVIAVRRPTPAPTFESEGLPLPPAAVVAAAQKDGSIQVSWKVVRNVQGYKVIRSKNGIPDSVSQVAPEQLAFSATGLDPRTKYCFTVETFRGAKLTSDVSGAACAVTLPVAGPGGPSGSGASSPGAGGGPGGPGGSGSAGASGSAPGGPSGASTGAGSSSPSAPTSATSTAPADKYGPDDWILIVGRLFDEQSDATAAQDAAALANSLRTQGIAATVLHSTDFPKLGIGLGVKHPFYAAYLAGPFSQTEATDRALTYRSETGLVVSPVQPNPAQ